jgi:predicted nucleotidyltransferase
MAVDYETIIQISKNYANDVKKVLPVNKVVLFGSHAKRNATELSDVDICFFLDSYKGKNRVTILEKLLSLTHEHDAYFEPIVFTTSDLYDDNPFVKEILSTGIDIL